MKDHTPAPATRRKQVQVPLALRLVRWGFPKLEAIAPAIARRYFLKVFFSPLRYATPDKERKAESYGQPFTIQAAGKQVQGLAWGEGSRYVLMVHGWAGRGTQFRRFIKPFQRAGYRVVAFDGPAHGRSEGKTTTILEFEEAIRQVYARFGQPEAIVAHSFGGVASLYAVMQGLPLQRLINIASPTIGDEVIRTYLRAINGSWKTGEYFKDYMVKTYGKSFDEFSSLHFIRHLPKPLDLLLVHDANDKEVTLQHSLALREAYPAAHLIQTQGLGHTRILKDNDVIRQVVTFATTGASA